MLTQPGVAQQSGDGPQACSLVLLRKRSPAGGSGTWHSDHQRSGCCPKPLAARCSQCYGFLPKTTGKSKPQGFLWPQLEGPVMWHQSTLTCAQNLQLGIHLSLWRDSSLMGQTWASACSGKAEIYPLHPQKRCPWQGLCLLRRGHIWQVLFGTAVWNQVQEAQISGLSSQQKRPVVLWPSENYSSKEIQREEWWSYLQWRTYS